VANEGFATPFLFFIKKAAVLAKKKKVTARSFAIASAKLAKERRCSNVVVFDLKGRSPVTDYFVIATGTSNRQMKTVADEITEIGKTSGFSLYGRAGYEQAKWILLDFVDLVVHIFDEEYRDYYDLELLWGDAKKMIIAK
jgi:ribosome-associated protein